ncbi:MAG: hypothetical protein MUE99_07305, partial [Chitinophagaceae bacterium]|nr:hypothetical protein [Chitinophagaceae bacterium]
MIRKLRNAFSCGILLTACLLSLSVEIFSQPVWNTGSSNQQNASGTGTSYSITRPTNIVAGDLVILILTQQRSSPTANTSSFVPNAANGFTLIAASNDANNDRTSIAAYFKIAGASEPVSYTGTVTQFASVTPSWKASVTRVTGHNRSNPIGPNNVANAFNTSNISIPQISIKSGNSLLVASRSVRVQTGALNTVPTGMTQNLFSNGTGTVDASTNAPSFQVATQLLASGGNTGVKQFTWTATSSEVYAAGLMFSINPLIIPVTGISTNFGGYWATNIATNNPIEPNNSHELLSFTYNGTQFSTGVNDATLTANGVPFTPGNYRGVPFVGLPGSLSSNTSNTLLAMASLKDGNPLQGVATHPNINGKTIRDVLTDGIRGLDLGTGVTNLPSSAVISFSISSIREDAIADDFPDLLVTQIAQPGGTTDIYGFYDAAGVLIGNLVSQVQSSLLQLGIYRLDLF